MRSAFPSTLGKASGLNDSPLKSDKLTFRSSLHPLSRTFQDILGTFSRPSALNALPVLTFPSGYPAAFPAFQLSSHTSSLPLPPRATSPSRLQPIARSRVPLNAPSRLSTTFTSLFSKSASGAAPTPVDTATATATATATTASAADTEHTVNISAFAIDRHLDGQSVGKEVNQAIRSELETALAGVPSWVQEHVFEFAEALYPLVQAEQKGTQAPGNESPPYVVNTLQEPPAGASERFQDFYAELEQLLRIEEPSPARDHPEQGASEEEEHGRPTAISEDAIREILELVEGALCSIFYDRSVCPVHTASAARLDGVFFSFCRIYLLSTSDDASHDETLSSRIAALNMLDLTLEHLDVQVDGARHELDHVVKSCGESECERESD